MSSKLLASIKAFIQHRKGNFQQLADKLLRYHQSQRKAYRNLSPPYLPTSLLKTISPELQGKHLFLTSGTTTKQRGRHALPKLDLYRLAARTSFYEHFSADGFLFLSPRYTPQSHSSLLCMFSFLENEHSLYAIEKGKWNWQGIQKFLKYFPEGKKLCVFSTYLSLADFLKKAPHELPFPRKSFLIITGGFKEQKEASREWLEQESTRRFGFEKTYEEYGMTELSACFYGERGEFMDLHFARSYVFDPLSRKLRSKNGEGLLCFIDLSNAYTYPFLMTEDWGRKTASGFQLLGRLPFSEPRGCSLQLKEWLS